MRTPVDLAKSHNSAILPSVDHKLNSTNSPLKPANYSQTFKMLPRIVLPTARVASRTAFLRATVPARRGVHIENGVYNNFPFNYKNRAAFTAGYFGVMTTLFTLPFVAVGYQLSKKSGGSPA